MTKICCTILVFPLLLGCIQPFDVETQIFEGVLVVDARLSDEEKQHEVLLSRARPFEQDSISAEGNATVSIIDNTGTTYNFTEVEPGKYVSNTSFSAQQNTAYQLEIRTSNAFEFSSESITTPSQATISNLYAERATNDSGEGVGIFLDNADVSSDLNYFRYEYEEAFKIIAPFWDPFEFEVLDDIWFGVEDPQDGYEVGIKLREQEERVCYNELSSTQIIQTATKGLAENTIERFLVRFLDRNNYIISHRYSILVKQFAQTQEAFNYYQKLEEFSSSESVFADVQPGFLAGNINSQSNFDAQVIGYFEVASVSEKRIFFNYSDLFPGEPLPPYAINCEPTGAPLIDVPTLGGPPRSPLIDGIRSEAFTFFGENEVPPEDPTFFAPFFTKERACGDCTVLGSTLKPDFWID